MKANEINLNKFLSQSDTRFVIPIYQRNYDWGDSQCKQLLDDILELSNKEELNAHFIGSIVYIRDDVYSVSDINELTIIDGQQRLTTVTLIYLVLHRLAQELGKTSLTNQIYETYLINKFAEGDEKLKLRPTENNDRALKYILQNDNLKEYTDFSRIIENFNYFQSRISEENYQFVLKGLKKLMFVEISLERGKDDPQRIFESLNSTGLELSQADLIRNYILMDLNRELQNKIYTVYWEHIERLAKDESKNSSKVSDYIRDYLTLENKKIPNKNKVYQEFKFKYPTSTVAVLEQNLTVLKKFAYHYNKLLNPANEKDRDIRLQLEYINRLEINVAYPFLIKVYDDYSSRAITKQDFISVLELIQSFTWRRFIMGLSSNSLNKIFMRLYEDVNTQNYLYSLQLSLIQKKGSQRFPRDRELIDALERKNMYEIKAKNRMYFLDRLENYQNNEPVKIEDNEDITVEHIFPQNPVQQWKNELGEMEFNTINNNYLNTIANLTLSGNNGKLGNKTFIEKRDMNVDGKEQGYKYSRLWLNRYLSEIDRWGIKEIETRFEMIVDRFLKVWLFPDIEIEEKMDFNEVNIFDAEDPTGKKLKYAIFFDRKLEISEMSKLYLEVMKHFFDSQPQAFFTSDLAEKISLTKDPNRCRQATAINETYFIEANIDNKGKFERIKKALTIFDCEDELIIKYKS
ncbi:DUF262 domain-containing protein [Lyngbya sp. CCY1209]|uniref:DUF262 domain-containing protein n=1 Tax=Lyngbya sp. CCY1209 TaxID=2886103 RepID=UPI002D202B8D|nr:DUF262 domain-containing protein [Lyngbya sp. CCY1209]MEB3882968.1 DUF262 domain-containing HNH endonuclease family protein [Lyngbya sp. CCY1209]